MRKVNFSGRIDCLFAKKKKQKKIQVVPNYFLTFDCWNMVVMFPSFLFLCMDFFDKKK